MTGKPLALTSILLLVSLAGCLGGSDAPASNGADDAGDGSDGMPSGNEGERSEPNEGPGGDNGTGDGDGNDTSAEETTIDDLSANETVADAPATISFHVAARSPDDDAQWRLVFGDGEDLDGAVSDLPANVEHVYESPGEYTANLTVEASDGTVDASVTVTVLEPAAEPIDKEFEYGPTLGCVGDVINTCISLEQGPDGSAVDGVWQALGPRYWGLAFNSTVANLRGDSDCWAIDDAGEVMTDVDLNGGAGPCQGVVPNGTQWLFLYSYAEPAPAMSLTFE